MKPMLAATCEEISAITYPVLASPKLDGIRAVVLNGQLVSRNLKPIRNAHVYTKFSHVSMDGLDGELIDGAHDSTVFRRTTSAVSRAMGEPKDVKFWVFDVHMPNATFAERQSYLQSAQWSAGVKLVPHVWIEDQFQLAAYEEKCLNDGFEGVMVRSPHGPYKQGRSTLREGWLLKVKRFEDAEAEIIGFEERMHNGNTLTTDALGHAKRSSHAENMVGRGDLGAMLVRGVSGPYAGVEFSIGTGFDDAERSVLWRERSDLIGQQVKFKYFPMGSKDRPRFPVFLGFREQGT